MWQTSITLLIIAAVSVFLIRHMAKAWRSESSMCSSCSSCPAHPAGGRDDAGATGTVECKCPKPPGEHNPEGRRSDRQ